MLLPVLVLSPPWPTEDEYGKRSSMAIRPHWSESYRKPQRPTCGSVAVQTAIEYEYRFTEYRFAKYEYDEKLFDAPTKRKVIAWGNVLGWIYAAMFRPYRRLSSGSVDLLARTWFRRAEAPSSPLATG